MPERLVIADTGPLVAYLNADDQYHDWAVEQMRLLPSPLLTCEPVLTETFHRVRRARRGIAQLSNCSTPACSRSRWT